MSSHRLQLLMYQRSILTRREITHTVGVVPIELSPAGESILMRQRQGSDLTHANTLKHTA